MRQDRGLQFHRAFPKERGVQPRERTVLGDPAVAGEPAELLRLQEASAEEQVHRQDGQEQAAGPRRLTSRTPRVYRLRSEPRFDRPGHVLPGHVPDNQPPSARRVQHVRQSRADWHQEGETVQRMLEPGDPSAASREPRSAEESS